MGRYTMSSLVGELIAVSSGEEEDSAKSIPLLREAKSVLRIASEGEWTEVELVALMQLRATLILAARTSQEMF